jgi:hypothetical protein
MTTQNKDLQSKINELTERHNLQQEIESKLPGLDIYTNFFSHKSLGTTKTFTVKLQDTPLNKIADIIQTVITEFKPSSNAKLSFAGKNDVETNSPFVLRWKNDVRSNIAQIDYVSGEYWIHIDLPIGYYSDDVKGVFQRKVYDSEYHYFTAKSQRAIDNMRLIAYQLDMFESVKYYGGDVVNYINHDDDKAEFESVVLKGHTPEFADFWANQLQEIK